MLIKDQLKVRMDQLDISPQELARRVGVSGQSVRHWMDGRNYPTKAKTSLIEQALGCRLDFSEGSAVQSVTVDETLRQGDIDTFLVMAKLPPDVQSLITQLAQRFLDIQNGEQQVGRSAPDAAATPMRHDGIQHSPRRTTHA